jgi:tRNA-dihydrouridine synthase 3
VAAAPEGCDAWAGLVRREARLRACEKRKIDFADKLYVAPLTTVGNLPFRRVMLDMGADITIGEMALASEIVSGSGTEWALLRRHPSERCFGVQLAGSNVDTMMRAAELIERHCSVDFVDINSGCPLDALCNKGMGAGMMGKAGRMRDTLRGMHRILSCPLTLKIRTGLDQAAEARFAHKLVQKVRLWSVSGPFSFALPPTDATHAASTPNANSCALSPFLANVMEDDSEFGVGPQAIVSAITVHGRTRQQRYSRYADWDYIQRCATAARASVLTTRDGMTREMGLGLDEAAAVVRRSVWDATAAATGGAGAVASGRPVFSAETLAAMPPLTLKQGTLYDFRPPFLPEVPLIGNGDVFSWEDYYEHREKHGVATCLLGRGALIKPWLLREIREQTHIDIRSSERLDILRSFANYGLEHWGSDQSGVNKTRRFLLEWLSFLHRYIPVGLLEVLPQRMNDRPPMYYGRDDLETLMASPNCEDWIRITEMLLGPVPDDFVFVPKHKSNSYAVDDAPGARVGVTAPAGKGAWGAAGQKRSRPQDNDDPWGDAEG